MLAWHGMRRGRIINRNDYCTGEKAAGISSLFGLNPTLTLVANLFHHYKAEISAEFFPSLGAFREVKCEAKF
jgi:hypothetical protein